MNAGKEKLVTRAILFRGWFDPWHREVSTGFDKTGYVTTDGMVIHPRRSRIAQTPLSKIERRPHRFLDLPNLPHAHQIEQFFTKNVISNTMYVMALQQIVNEKFPFWKSPIKLPILSPISDSEHERRWQQMQALIQPADGIFTIDTENLASRLIAYLDQGTWSHVGTYAGNGNILEAISHGIVERSIEAYHHPRYRLGVYRLPGATSEQIERMITWARLQVGGGYNYKHALALGLRLIFGMRPDLPDRHMTPNMLIPMWGYELVTLV